LTQTDGPLLPVFQAHGALFRRRGDC